MLIAEEVKRTYFNVIQKLSTTKCELLMMNECIAVRVDLYVIE